jgi:cytoskeletal protein CcmA (bactofilin family)
MWNRQQSDPTRHDETDELSARARQPSAARASDVATLGKTVYVKGELTGAENLTIDGRVEGRIDLPDHLLTIQPNAIIEADIVAKTVIAFGSVVGGVTARDRLEIRRSGSIVGEVVCGCLTIQDGAFFEGKVEMTPRQATTE